MEDSITLINNNDYGAPELQRVYRRNLREALVIAILFHIAAIAAYLLITYINQANADEKKIPLSRDYKIVEIDESPSINDEPPKIKPEEIMKPPKNISALEPKLVPKELSDNVLMKTQDELDKTQNNVSSKGDSVLYVLGNDIVGKIDEDKITDKIKKDIDKPDKQVFENFEVGVAPECTNLQQVKSSIEYPKLAVDAGIEGRVTVRVMVGEDGNVLKVGSITGSEIFYEEVKEKSKNLIFTPGLQNNKAVNVWVTVPFVFKLKN
jgi:periplasmic protein TonB